MSTYYISMAEWNPDPNSPVMVSFLDLQPGDVIMCRKKHKKQRNFDATGYRYGVRVSHLSDKHDIVDASGWFPKSLVTKANSAEKPTISTFPPRFQSPPFFVMALKSFKPQHPTHLRFRKREILTVLKVHPSGWWIARSPRCGEGSVGLIPASYTTGSSHSMVQVVKPKVSALKDEPYEVKTPTRRREGSPKSSKSPDSSSQDVSPLNLKSLPRTYSLKNHLVSPRSTDGLKIRGESMSGFKYSLSFSGADSPVRNSPSRITDGSKTARRHKSSTKKIKRSLSAEFKNDVPAISKSPKSARKRRKSHSKFSNAHHNYTTKNTSRPKWMETQMTVLAGKDHVALRPDEISCTKGSKISIFSNQGEWWFGATASGSIGFIPKDVVVNLE